MRAGSLDREIVIQSFTEAQDASGQPIQTWVTFASVYAHRRDVRGQERFTSDQRMAIRTATFRIRWLAGVTEEMQIVDAGSTYRITGIADDQRDGWMEIAAEAINPEASQ
jgi:SPP1 family predicted phage head-tail adaptor